VKATSTFWQAPAGALAFGFEAVMLVVVVQGAQVYFSRIARL